MTGKVFYRSIDRYKQQNDSTVEHSIYYVCGTFHILCVLNVQHIMFVERSTYYVCGSFLMSLPFYYQFPFTAALDRECIYEVSDC
jgi:hypothetical protein